MSDELYEVAFSGQVSAGADLELVKQKVGKMFNADEAKLAQLFSGKRIVIKKNIDQATAAKYKTALTRAGAECEVKSMSGAPAAAPAAESPAVATPATATASSSTSAPAAASGSYETNYSGEVAPPPKTDPLGITPDQIEELSASLAPVGSELQDDVKAPEAPEFDLSGIDVAPVGSDLGTAKKEPDPPPPDTSGITMAD